MNQLLALHRHLYQQDTRLPMTSRSVPSETEPILIDGAYVDVTDTGPLGGMPFSPRMSRYLGHPENYGMAFPWSRALWCLRVECRRSHRFHRGPTVPYWRGSLCHQLVTFTVIRGWSVENAAKILRYDNPEPILRNAFRYIEATIDADRVKAERRAREDAGTGPGPIPQPMMVHHAVDGLHRQECPQCRRGVA